MLEKVTNTLLLPIMIFYFGYYLPEEMMNNVSATVHDCYYYIGICVLFAVVFLLRRKYPERVYRFFLVISFIGCCYTLSMLVTSQSSWGMMARRIGLIPTGYCLFYITRMKLHLHHMKKTEIIILSVLASAAIGFDIKIITFVVSLNRFPGITLFSCFLFMGVILYLLSLFFAFFYKDNINFHYGDNNDNT